MAMEKITVIFTVLVVICFGFSEGQKCYTCTGTNIGHDMHSPEEHAKHMKCLDPTELTPADSANIKDCGLTGGCQKTKTILGDTVTIVRDCGIANDDCVEKEQGTAKVSVCFCKGNLCNSAPVTKSTFILIASIFLCLGAYFF